MASYIPRFNSQPIDSTRIRFASHSFTTHSPSSHPWLLERGPSAPALLSLFTIAQHHSVTHHHHQLTTLLGAEDLSSLCGRYVVHNTLTEPLKTKDENMRQTIDSKFETRTKMTIGMNDKNEHDHGPAAEQELYPSDSVLSRGTSFVTSLRINRQDLLREGTRTRIATTCTGRISIPASVEFDPLGRL